MVGGDHDVPKLTLRSGLLRTLGLDLVGPLLVFQVCRRAGVAEVWSLVIAGVLPAIAVVVDWMRFRTVQVLGIVVLGGLALAVVLALVSDDPKTVLLEGAIVTAAFGVACLVSLVVGRRPLIFYFAQAFYGGPHTSEGIQLGVDHDRYSEARRFWRIGTAVWGIVYLAQALARLIVIETFSTATALAVIRTASWVITLSLIVWMFSWGSRLQAEQTDTAPPPGLPDDPPS